jgi:hypothetical protein
MAFGLPKQGTSNETPQPQQQQETTAATDDVMDADFMAEMSGKGLESFTSDTVSTAYLSMVQPDSTAAVEGIPVGSWRNTATGEVYGPDVEVRVLAFRTIWTERLNEAPFTTVGRYEPYGIEVTTEHPKPGVRGYPKMTNPKTGNKVEELFIYACLIADHPEEGVVYLSPTAGSMKGCKAWNAQLRSQHLPNGQSASVFAYTWFLHLDTHEANPKAGQKAHVSLGKATRGTLLTKEVFVSSGVKQQLALANDTQLVIAANPETSGDTVEATE